MEVFWFLVVVGVALVWCGVVWCGVVLCGVVWCGVVWRGGMGVVPVQWVVRLRGKSV